MKVYELKACFVEMLGDMNRREHVENSLAAGSLYATLAAAQKALADDVAIEWDSAREECDDMAETKELKWEIEPGTWTVFIEELELIYRITEVEVEP
jgi:hypothetical protein